jgi:hypothetical protein
VKEPIYQIEIRQTRSIGFKKLIEYLYTKQFNLKDVGGDIKNLVDVLTVSDKCGCLKLKYEVQRVISMKLTYHTVSGLLVISDRHNALNLREACSVYLRDNYRIVKKTRQYRKLRLQVEKILAEFGITFKRNNKKVNKPNENCSIA